MVRCDFELAEAVLEIARRRSEWVRSGAEIVCGCLELPARRRLDRDHARGIRARPVRALHRLCRSGVRERSKEGLEWRAGFELCGGVRTGGKCCLSVGDEGIDREKAIRGLTRWIHPRDVEHRRPCCFCSGRSHVLECALDVSDKNVARRVRPRFTGNRRRWVSNSGQKTTLRLRESLYSNHLPHEGDGENGVQRAVTAA